MYSPDAPFEVSTTNRYLVDTHEAAVTARADIARGEVIRHLTGVQVPLTKDEEKTLDLTRRDFSVVVSARKRTVSLFLGPARFANHDCDANARLRTCGNRGMEVIAVKDIKTGEEITVTYSEDYFGIDNRECLCATCEQYERNGWAEDSSPGPESRMRSANRDAEIASPRSRSQSGTGSNSRSSSKARQGSSTPTRKRKSDVAGLNVGERSPKRPEFARVSDTSGKRASSSLSNEVRPQDIPEPNQSAPHDHISSPLGFSASTSSKSSHADAVSSSTAPTSLSEDPNLAQNKYRVERVKSVNDRESNVNEAQTEGSQPTQLSVAAVRSEQPGFESRSTSSQADRNSLKEGFQSEKLVSRLESASKDIGMPVIAEPLEDVAEFNESASKNRKLPDTKGRRPGDYTLTARLLCTPYSRWVQCKVCDSDFVQTDAYQTRFACPRCERHSKLYGYMWPKTEKEGKFDDEERILDHREVNRFVGPQQEKEIKKGKEKALKNLLKEREERVSSSGQDDDEWEDVTPVRGRVFRKSLGKRTFYGRDQEVEDFFSLKKRDNPLDLFPLNEAASKQQKQKVDNSVRSKKARHHIQTSRTKRKYVRSGHYTREAMAERAAAREAMRIQLKREKQQRRKQLKQAKQASASKIKAGLVSAKTPTPKAKATVSKSTTPLPPGMKESKWKGWVLVPETDENVINKKMYDATGRRILDDNTPETPIEPRWRGTSSNTPTSASRATRPVSRTASAVAYQPQSKRKYVRSGKYVGVAEARRKRRPLPPPIPRPEAVNRRVTILSFKPRPISQPRSPDEIQYDSGKARKILVEPTDYIKQEDQDEEEAEVTNSSLYETVSDSDSASVASSSSEFHSAELESESEFETHSRNPISVRQRVEPTRKSTRAPKSLSPALKTETRSARRASRATHEEARVTQQSPSLGKLKRVSPGKRPPLPRGWEYQFPDEEVEEGSKEELEAEMDIDWEAEASAVARARATSFARRSRKTI